MSSLGEPSWPPPSPSSEPPCEPPSSPQSIVNNDESHNRSLDSNSLCQLPVQNSLEFDKDIGLDTEALIYEMDKGTNFQLDDGTYLEGQSLVDHLIHTNDILKDRIKVYCDKCNE